MDIIERAKRSKAIADNAKRVFWKNIEAKKTVSMEFKFRESLDENGILYFLGTKGNTEEYVNPAV